MGVDVDEGLPASEVAERTRLLGRNVIETGRAISVWTVLLNQLRSAVVLLLIGAAVAAAAIGHDIEAAAVGVVLIVNTLIGFVTELRAARSMEALGALAAPITDVERDGRRDEIDAADLVPGDVVWMEAGDRVPADVRLFEAHEFTVDESALTGENEPVFKQSEPVDPAAELPDRASMVHMGTLAKTGRARGIVTATGMQTEVGRIARLTLATPRTEAPLQAGLERLARGLSLSVVLLAALLAGIGYLRGLDLYEILEVSIALAVAIVPEGLPAVATLTLTLGMRRMAAENALVRRLSVVETLGSVTAIASDKTGTLTANQMVVTDVALAPGHSIESLWESAVQCNDADVAPDGDPVGDATEVALLLAAGEAGFDWRTLKETQQRTLEVPFSPQTKRMAVVVGDTVHLKGAPEVLAAATASARLLPELQAATEAMSQRALRTLAIARNARPADDVCATALRENPPGPCVEALFDGLEIIGVVGIEDPVRPEAVTAAETLRQAGIRVLMLTGDRPGTAAAVGDALRLATERIGRGTEIEAVDDSELAERVRSTDVWARVAPEHKLRIVRALQSNGDIVAVTGDGVNDAPALRQANVGIAMGLAGTDVAREAADIVLMDDDFATIEKAVEEGRRVFSNIRRFAQFLFSWHLSVVIVVAASLAAGLPAPLAGLMILWNNLIIDVIPSFALALEPSGADAMRQRPRPTGESVVGRETLKRIAAQGVLVAGVSLTAFVLAIGSWGFTIGEAQTVTFVTLTAAQLMAVFNARTEQGNGFAGASRSPWLWIALAVTIALEVIAVSVAPLRDVLGLETIDASVWPVLFGLATIPLFLTQAKRIWQASRTR